MGRLQREESTQTSQFAGHRTWHCAVREGWIHDIKQISPWFPDSPSYSLPPPARKLWNIHFVLIVLGEQFVSQTPQWGDFPPVSTTIQKRWFVLLLIPAGIHSETCIQTMPFTWEGQLTVSASSTILECNSIFWFDAQYYYTRIIIHNWDFSKNTGSAECWTRTTLDLFTS